MSDSLPLVRRDTTSQTPYRRIEHGNTCIPYPDEWPEYRNGASASPCDMLQGPCSCGAWHDLNEWEIAPNGADIARRCDQPYLTEIRTGVIRLYNPKFGDDRMCQCGHLYYRHFDGYEEHKEDRAVGCKYCSCDTFVEASPDMDVNNS